MPHQNIPDAGRPLGSLPSTAAPQLFTMSKGQKNDITAAQCRAARALLGWSQGRLAEASKVSRATLAEFEQGKRVPYRRTLRDLEAALSAAGVLLVSDGEMVLGGRGVRLVSNAERARPDQLPDQDDIRSDVRSD